ncbi:MAG: hypothetical protein WC819_01960 [Parcubacteria group bacterium]|jgi:phosphoribosylpyrophosphate synthetase
MKQGKRWGDVIIFTGLDNDPLVEGICLKLREYLREDPQKGHIRYGYFDDGEIKDFFPEFDELRGKTIVFYECLKSFETTMRLLQLCWAAKYHYGAKHIIIATSFLHYRRQDHPEKIHEIHRNRWLMEMMKANGVDHLIVATPHSDQTRKNCEDVGIVFREVDYTEAFASVCKDFLPEKGEDKKAFVFAPDEGAIARAIAFARLLDVDVLFKIKDRGHNNEVAIVEAAQEKIDQIIAKHGYDRLYYAIPERIKDAIMIMIDDEVTTGTTANKQAKNLLQWGSAMIMLFVTHPVCSNQWIEKLFDGEPFAKICFTNTIFRGKMHRTNGGVHDVSAAGFMASGIFRVLRQLYDR